MYVTSYTAPSQDASPETNTGSEDVIVTAQHELLGISVKGTKSAIQSIIVFSGHSTTNTHSSSPSSSSAKSNEPSSSLGPINPLPLVSAPLPSSLSISS